MQDVQPTPLSSSKPRSFGKKFSFCAFEDGSGHLPNNPLIAAVFSAIFKGGANARFLLGGWFVTESGALELHHIGRKGGLIRVKIDPALFPTADTDAQWRFVESLSSLTADTAMAVLAELCHPGTGKRTKFPMMQSVSLTADHVMRYKKFQRYGGERTDFRQRIEDEFRKLQALRLDVVDYPGWDVARNCWNPNGVSVIGDKVFDLIEADLAFQGGERRRIWLARLGTWARIWMNAQAKVWLVQIPHAVLALDHRQNRAVDSLGKKLAVHGLMLGATAKSRPTLIRRVDRLLEDLGELPAEPYRTNHWAGRMRDRLEEALMQLVEQRVFDKIEWDAEFGPGSPDRFKGWTQPWLASKIHMALTQQNEA